MRRGRESTDPGYRMSCSAMWSGQGIAVLTFPMKKRLKHAENRSILRKMSSSCLTLCQPLRYDFYLRLCVSRQREREREYIATSKSMYTDTDFQAMARQNLTIFRFAL